MFVTRLVSGIVLVAVALATILLGGPVLLATILFITLVGMHEFYGAMRIVKPNRAQKKVEGKEYEAKDKYIKEAPESSFTLLAAVGFCGAVGYDLALYFCPENIWLMEVVAVFLLILCLYIPHLQRRGCHCRVFRLFLSRCKSGIRVYDPYASDRKDPCMADLSQLVGRGYLRLLCRASARKA